MRFNKTPWAAALSGATCSSIQAKNGHGSCFPLEPFGDTCDTKTSPTGLAGTGVCGCASANAIKLNTTITMKSRQLYFISRLLMTFDWFRFIHLHLVVATPTFRPSPFPGISCSLPSFTMAQFSKPGQFFNAAVTLNKRAHCINSQVLPCPRQSRPTVLQGTHSPFGARPGCLLISSTCLISSSNCHLVALGVTLHTRSGTFS